MLPTIGAMDNRIVALRSSDEAVTAVGALLANKKRASDTQSAATVKIWQITDNRGFSTAARLHVVCSSMMDELP